MTIKDLQEAINDMIAANNPGAPKDVLVEKLEDVDEIFKAKEQMIEIIRQL